jgi:hypothetical protein
MNINWGKLVLASVFFTIVSQIVHTLSAMASMNFYLDPAYFAVWSKIMMPVPGAPPLEFIYLSMAFAFISALIYAGVYNYIRFSVPGKNWLQKGVNYGVMLFYITQIPSALTLLLLINVPWALVGVWAAENLVVLVVGGAIIGKLIQ